MAINLRSLHTERAQADSPHPEPPAGGSARLRPLCKSLGDWKLQKPRQINKTTLGRAGSPRQVIFPPRGTRHGERRRESARLGSTSSQEGQDASPRRHTGNTLQIALFALGKPMQARHKACECMLASEVIRNRSPLPSHSINLAQIGSAPNNN